MKLVDYALVFVILVWCVFSNVSIKNRLLQESVYSNAVSNNIMDNVVEGTLQETITFENYIPVIEEKKVTEVLLKQINNFKLENENMTEYFKDCVKLAVIVYPDGYKLAKDFQWEKKVFFSEGELTSTEKKMNELLVDIQNRYGMNIYVARNDGDTLSNTIDDYSLLIVYETYPYIYMGKEYKNLTFSGAKITYDITFYDKKTGRE